MQLGEPTCGISPGRCREFRTAIVVLRGVRESPQLAFVPAPEQRPLDLRRFGRGEAGTGIALESAKGVHHGFSCLPWRQR
jgi:hypothetical protein